jgi:hypothetical protein
MSRTVQTLGRSTRQGQESRRLSSGVGSQWQTRRACQSGETNREDQHHLQILSTGFPSAYEGCSERNSHVSLRNTHVSFGTRIPICNRILILIGHVFSLLGADQKGKVRANMQKDTRRDLSRPKDPADEITFFYRCQSSSATGDVKGCGFFQLLDCEKEGKGPLIGQRVDPSDDGDSSDHVSK